MIQLHSGSGIFDPDPETPETPELVDPVPELVDPDDPVVPVLGGLGCNGHVICKFLGYWVGIPDKWLAAARA